MDFFRKPELPHRSLGPHPGIGLPASGSRSEPGSWRLRFLQDPQDEITYDFRISRTFFTLNLVRFHSQSRTNFIPLVRFSSLSQRISSLSQRISRLSQRISRLSQLSFTAPLQTRNSRRSTTECEISPSRVERSRRVTTLKFRSSNLSAFHGPPTHHSARRAATAVGRGGAPSASSTRPSKSPTPFARSLAVEPRCREGATGARRRPRHTVDCKRGTCGRARAHERLPGGDRARAAHGAGSANARLAVDARHGRAAAR